MELFMFLYEKRWARIICCILVFLLLAAALLWLFDRPWYYRLFYWGNRIKGTIELTVDGQRVPFEMGSIENPQELFPRSSVFTESDNSVKLSIHAGDYGRYRFHIYHDALSKPIRVTVYQYNWWNVCDFKLMIDVDTNAGTVHCVSEARILNEEGKIESEKNDALYRITDGQVNHWVVSV